MTMDELVQREEQKRQRCCDARQRWRVLQETIEWVDRQQAVPRNSRQACLAKQALLLKGHGCTVRKENLRNAIEKAQGLQPLGLV